MHARSLKALEKKTDKPNTIIIKSSPAPRIITFILN